MINGFDTHVHFDGIASGGGLDPILCAAAAAGVSRMIAIGGDAGRNRFAVDFAGMHGDCVRAAVGYDRDCAGGKSPVADLESLLKPETLVVAIGEIGLDYHYHPDNQPAQRELLARMLELARRLCLPVIVHSREADEDTVAMLKEHGSACNAEMQGRVGLLHCFTGDASFARRLIDLDFYVSFSGIVTFRNADSIRAAANIVPADRLLIETDSPYLAPVPHRGRQNEPALLPHVAETLATVRGEGVGEIAETTFQNASRLFGWPIAGDPTS